MEVPNIILVVIISKQQKKTTKSGLDVTEFRIQIFKKKNEIGLGGDRNSNLNFPKKTKSGLEVTEIRN